MKWLPSLSFSVGKSDQILEMWWSPVAIPRGLHPANALGIRLALACRLEFLRNSGVGFALLCSALVPTSNITGWHLEHFLTTWKMWIITFLQKEEIHIVPLASRVRAVRAEAGWERVQHAAVQAVTFTATLPVNGGCREFWKWSCRCLWLRGAPGHEIYMAPYRLERNTQFPVSWEISDLL